MKTPVLLLVLVALTQAAFASEAKIPGEEALVLALAESALIEKFGAEAVDTIRPLRVRVVRPGLWWRVEGTRPEKRVFADEDPFATVQNRDGQLRATALKRKLDQKRPNTVPEPMSGLRPAAAPL